MGGNGAPPDGWRRVPFVEVADVNPRRAVPAGALAPYIEMAAVREDTRGIASYAMRVANGGGSRFQNGDTIFARITPCAENGKIALVECLPDGERAVGSTEFIVLGPKVDLLDPKFLFYWASSSWVRALAISRMTGTSGRQRIPDSLFRDEIEILVPPVGEQQRIVGLLGSIDETIERTETVVAGAVQAKQALAHELLTRGLPGRHTRFKHTAAGEVPERWEVIELADCGRWVSGGTPTRDRADFWNGSIPWISGKDMKSQRLTDAEEHITQDAVRAGATLMESGTILIVVRGMILAHTMPLAVLERPAAFNQDLKALQCRGDVNPYFVLYALSDRAEQLLDLVDEATHGTKRLPTERLMAVALPHPPLEEQEAVVRAIEDCDKRIESERSHLEQLREMKQRLARALLTGEVRMPVEMS